MKGHLSFFWTGLCGFISSFPLICLCVWCFFVFSAREECIASWPKIKIKIKIKSIGYPTISHLFDNTVCVSSLWLYTAMVIMHLLMLSPSPGQYKEGGDAVGIWPSRKSPTWRWPTKSKAHLLMHGNEKVWYLALMTGQISWPLGKTSKFKSPPKAWYGRTWGVGLDIERWIRWMFVHNFGSAGPQKRCDH